jgi:hypothetical protein
MSISKIGAEFAVNTTTANAQYASSVTAFDPDSFFVAFANDTGLVYPAQRISGQRIDSDGTPIGGEVVLAPSTLDSGDPDFPTNIHAQTRPELARLSGGTVIAVWEDARGDGTNELRWRLADGTSEDSEGTLVSDVGDNQIDAAIAPLADGGFVVTWSVQGGLGVDEIFYRVFDADGSARSAVLPANVEHASFQRSSDVIGLTGGRFLVTWTDASGTAPDADFTGVRGRLFEANGTPVDGEFLVNTTTFGTQSRPSLTRLDNGGFVAAWQGDINTTAHPFTHGIVAQMFDAAGAKVGDEILVGEYDNGLALDSVEIAATPDGGFLAVWREFDGSDGGIFARQLGADGSARGAEVRLNSIVTGDQGDPHVAMLADGWALVTWTAPSTNGDVYGQVLQISGANAAPSGAGRTIAIDEDTSHVFAIGDFSFTDADGDAFAAVRLASIPAAGWLTNRNSILNAGDVVSVADIADGHFRFAPAANASGNAYASFTFQVQDDGGVADGGVDLDPTPNSIVLDVSAVNDAPAAVIVPASYSLDAQLSVSLKNNGISVADVDGGNAVEMLTLSVDHGTLAVAPGGSGASVVGNNSSAVVISGTLAQINALLNSDAASSLSYNAASHGSDAVLSASLSDNGATGAGGAMTGTDSAIIRQAQVVDGTAGDDSFQPAPGSTNYNGGAGIDALSFGFRLVDATVSYQNNRVVIDSAAGHYEVTGFEIFNFADGTVNNNDDSRLVDDLFYFSQNHDVWNAHVDADWHYNVIGWQEGRDPNAFFDTSLYRAANPDVAGNPLVHYQMSGWVEARVPSLAFDARAYLEANPDVAAARIDPLWHFLVSGAGEGRQPVAPTELIAANGFDFAHYLANNPDVAAADVDPFWHYQHMGWQEGRNPNACFDTSDYLAVYTDVAAAGINPLDHYHLSGWREGRDPSLAFDTASYLAANADVAAAQIDPLVHFLLTGQHEGRTATADGVWG